MIRQRKRALRNLHERRFICLTCGNLQDAPKVKGITGIGHRKSMWCPVCKHKRLHEQVGPITMEDKDMAKCLICGKVEPVMNCICGDCLPKREKRGKLPKAELDAMIAAERAYWTNFMGRDEEERQALLDVWQATKAAMVVKTGVNCDGLQQFIGALIGGFGLAQDATNQEIYAILQLLGWEVYEEVQPDGTDL